MKNQKTALDWLYAGARVRVKPVTFFGKTHDGYVVNVRAVGEAPDGIYADCANDGSEDYRWCHADELEPLKETEA